MPRYLLLACVGVVLLGAAYFGAAQMAEANKLRASLADLVKERDALRKQLWDLKKSNQGPVARPDRNSVSPAGETNIAGDNSPGNLRAHRVRPEGGGFARAMNSPEALHLMSIQQKAGLDGRYASLFKKLNLNPAELSSSKTCSWNASPPSWM